MVCRLLANPPLIFSVRCLLLEKINHVCFEIPSGVVLEGVDWNRRHFITVLQYGIQKLIFQNISYQYCIIVVGFEFLHFDTYKNWILNHHVNYGILQQIGSFVDRPDSVQV